jgi:holo-[acyl-carrier protein] synthase
MIRGVGTDIVEIARIAQSLAATSEAFAQRVLAPNEHAQWIASGKTAVFVAKRWAIKEAFGKACGTGLRDPLTWQHLWVEHDALGAPTLCVAPQVQKWLKDRKIGRWHISVSDEKQLVIAFAIAEGEQSDE